MNEETITLESAELGPREFTMSEAKRLVKLEHSLGVQLWKPVKGAKYEILDGTIITRTSSKADKDA